MANNSGSKRQKPVAKKVGPLTFIEWVDHCTSGEINWQSIEALRELQPLLVWSAGWLIKETRQYIVLASTIGANQAAFGEIVILKNCITKRESLGRAQL